MSTPTEIWAGMTDPALNSAAVMAEKARVLSVRIQFSLKT
jgi:hypothetical protein